MSYTPAIISFEAIFHNIQVAYTADIQDYDLVKGSGNCKINKKKYVRVVCKCFYRSSFSQSN